jgi:hypothetical protein
LAELKAIIGAHCDKEVDFRFKEIDIGIIKLSFIFHKFEKVNHIKQVIDIVMPMIPIGIRCDWCLFLVVEDFSEEDFIQFLTEEKPEEWVLKSMAENNKRIAFLCEKYKLLVG